ncbi:MAG: S-methyl-5'-thioadenosine phosphorylase [Zetaproteobacteria bacterium]|nr:MAG: S-methyl-5'-thioadenosine phosphorylase [Zetaproteobacteria bacterium]
MQRMGIIGGSGLYRMEGMEFVEELELDTPFGKPSAPLTLARMHGKEIVFLPRHGSKHTTPPHRINYRANIYAMKLAGVSRIVSISAVGSLNENISPGDFVIVDQFVDRTHSRDDSFFDGPIVAHVSMADPVCPLLRHQLIDVCDALEISVHTSGTYLVMQGPQFSTRAESRLYRQWGMDVIGMTNLPEAKLAREAEICYATVAMCTDFDCWHETEEDVSVQSVIEIMQKNVAKAKKMLDKWLQLPSEENVCPHCARALDDGLFTELKTHDDDALKRIFALVERKL